MPFPVLAICAFACACPGHDAEIALHCPVATAPLPQLAPLLLLVSLYSLYDFTQSLISD